MTGRWLTAFLAVGLSLVSAASSSLADSAIALDFAVRTKEINAFLVDASRLAETRGGRGVQTFARREAADRQQLVTLLVDWAIKQRAAAREADLGSSLDMLGSIFGPSDRSITIVVHEGRPVLPDLAAQRGTGFDELYVASQTDALDRLIGFYVDFIKNGDDETLRRLAVRDLPRARRLRAQIAR